VRYDSSRTARSSARLHRSCIPLVIHIAYHRAKLAPATDDLLDLNRALVRCAAIWWSRIRTSRRAVPQSEGRMRAESGTLARRTSLRARALPRSSRRSRTAPSRELANSGSGGERRSHGRRQAGSRRDRSPRGLRVFDLRRVSKLDRDRVSHHVSKAPLAVPCAVEEVVVSSNQDATRSP